MNRIQTTGVVVITVLVAVVGYTGYWQYRNITPQSNTDLVNVTGDWQVCRNEEVEYEVKYPPGWYVLQLNDEGGAIGLVEGSDNCTGRRLMFVNSKRAPFRQTFSVDFWGNDYLLSPDTSKEKIDRLIFTPEIR